MMEQAQDEPSALELAQEENALRHLKQAIAGLMPLERQCVIGRLCRKKSWNEIAEELGLERDEVVAVLKRAHKRVSEYTNYFERDWYWRDGPASADA